MRPNLLAAVQASLDQAYGRAKELLKANRSALDALANALFERGYLDAAEIDAVLQATPLARPALGAKEVAMTPSSPGGSPNQPQDATDPELDADAAEVEPAAS
jgi:hypothetical protein